MSTQTLPPAVFARSLKTKPAKHLRQISPEVYAKAYNKKRFLEACAKRKADPVDVLARVFSAEAEKIPLEKRADLALRALAWLDKYDDEETQRETPRVEIVIVDSNTGAGPSEAAAAVEFVPV